MYEILETSLESLIKSENYNDIHEVLNKLSQSLGYMYFGYQYWPGKEKYGEVGFSGVVQCNYPDEWQRRYMDEAFYDDDPVVLFSSAREGTVEWRHIPRFNQSQERIMQEAASYGLQEGVVSSCFQRPTGRLQLTFTGPAYRGDLQLALEILPQIVPLMVVTFRRAHKLEEQLKWLTQRQRDVFFMLREGQRRKEIAENMSISLRQVDRHIAEIKIRSSA